ERDEEMAPSFAHHPAATLPSIERDGARLRLIAGTLAGRRSPVEVRSPMFYAEALLEAGSKLELDAEHEERGVYPVEGAIGIAGERFEPGRLLALAAGHPIELRALSAVRLMLLGGAPLSAALPGSHFRP